MDPFKEPSEGIPRTVQKVIIKAPITRPKSNLGIKQGALVGLKGGYKGTQTLQKGNTWTPKVCRIIAFYRYWAIILPTFGGLGNAESRLRVVG